MLVAEPFGVANPQKIEYGVCGALRLFDVLPANPPFSPFRRSVDLRLSPGLVVAHPLPIERTSSGAALLLVALSDSACWSADAHPQCP
jgi:hypothetical protein